MTTQSLEKLRRSWPLLVACCCLGLASSALGQGRLKRVITAHCPANGKPAQTRTFYNSDGEVVSSRRIVLDWNEDVDGDGIKDRRLQVQTDSFGNAWECWCLQHRPARAGRPERGQRFGYAYRPKSNGARIWFGGCFFERGANSIKAGTEISRLSARLRRFDEICHRNFEEPPTEDNLGVTQDDWSFKYFPLSRQRQKFRTQHRWNSVDPPEYEIISEVSCGPPAVVPAGLGPESVNPSGVDQRQGFSGNDGRAATALLDESNLPQWRYSLFRPIHDYSDGETRLFAAPAAVAVDDIMVIAAEGIDAPFVDGPAADPSGGAWVVEEWDDLHVVFRATADAGLVAGQPLGTFGFFSDLGVGEVNWAYGGEVFTEADTVFGPALHPLCPDAPSSASSPCSPQVP